MTYAEATAAFEAADKAWQAELVAAFGKQAGDARYEARGRGQPGTALQAAYLAREAAREAWDAARQVNMTAAMDMGMTPHEARALIG